MSDWTAAARSSKRCVTTKDDFHRNPEAFAVLSARVADGSLQHREHIVDGLERFPEVLRMLFSSENHGKLLLRP